MEITQADVIFHKKLESQKFLDLTLWKEKDINDFC